MDSTAFLVHTRSKSLTPLTQGIALPWWFVIEIGLPPALLSLMPPVQLWESFFFLKLHSFLVLMTKGGPPQASPPCWEGHFPEPAVSFLGLTIT